MKKITLTINKEKTNFYFGLGFLGKSLEEFKLDINELGERLTANPFLYAPKLMYYSLEYGYLREEKEFDVKYMDFVDSLDDDNAFVNGNIGKFLDAFTKSLTKDVPKSEDKASKKK
ncbi:MAG: hypothetical protein GY793_06515 [Proteobacteria bacterium]|nr:hypothetical protein [Pseudomonadota bacterium]